jgi:osmotically-inducible protein OsmY
MPRILALLLLPVLAGTLLFPASASTPPPKTAPAVTRAAVPSVNDAQLEATIRTKLAKSKIGKDGFRFHVQRGVVTWEGTTAVGQHKGAATRMARTSGAVQVVNNIKVTGKTTGPLRKAYVQP